MGEREPNKEIVGKGELFFLSHPGTLAVFSGYGLTVQPGRKDFLVGLLMVDRPRPADPEWLKEVEATFGECQLVPMTTTGERGIVCQMQIEPESQIHLRRFLTDKAIAIQKALEPLLKKLPRPVFALSWDKELRTWKSQIISNELPGELRDIFERIGYGCLAVESNIGVVHVCHAADSDIKGLYNKPVSYRWQLVKMPTAPLIRLEVMIFDQPETPFKLESFLNVAEKDQARILAQLAGQDKLYLAFYGDDLTHQFTKIVPHDEQQWQYLDELVGEATRYWEKIPPVKRDFDKAKAEFMRRFV